MTKAERTLRDQGYAFTGIYTWNKAEAKDRAAQLRAEGHKARVVLKPASPYSRGGGMDGYSVLWTEAKAEVAS